MKRLTGMAGGVLGVLVASATAEAFSVSYDQTITGSQGTMTSKVALKDDQFRIESVMGGSTAITIRNAEGVFTYLPQEGIAMRLPVRNASQQPVQGADNYPKYLQEHNARLVRSETWHGMACDVYEFTDPGLKGTTTAWVWKEKQFPVRMEMHGPDGLMTVELSNIQMGAAAQDAMFQLPPGVKPMDMGSTMGDLQKSMGADNKEP